MRNKPVILAILDGYGYNPSSYGNAIVAADTPNLDKLSTQWPISFLQASGMAVGLPEGQMGNSEVGHTNIGAGRTVYQELTRITKAIKDGAFFANEVLCQTMEGIEEGNALHIMGLLSDGGVHSHIEHIKALIKMAADQQVGKVWLHCFMDGRDVSPTSGASFLAEIISYSRQYPQVSLATVMGRFYAMDRDKRWERVEKAYRAVVKGKGEFSTDFVKSVENSYRKDITDEFIEPLISKAYHGMKDGDRVIFANFRPDRGRELSRGVADPAFDAFDCTGRPRVSLTTMTRYDATMGFAKVAYKPQSLDNTLGEYIAKMGLKQLRIAETEKYAHVTFFFNGGVEPPMEGEERILVPSPKVATYDLMPEMSAYELTEKLLSVLEKQKHDLIVLNYANCDMVGHTGDFGAAVKAVETVDTCIGRVCEAALDLGGVVLITADHGNADQMLDKEGNSITSHSLSIVPFCTVGSSRPLAEGGVLADIAPTILDLMELPRPAEMTGRSLLV